jgi:hypothetical protein
MFATTAPFPDRLLCVTVFIILRNLPTDNLAVEWKGLQHDVEALPVLVLEHQAEVNPEVVLAFPRLVPQWPRAAEAPMPKIACSI